MPEWVGSHYARVGGEPRVNMRGCSVQWAGTLHCAHCEVLIATRLTVCGQTNHLVRHLSLIYSLSQCLYSAYSTLWSSVFTCSGRAGLTATTLLNQNYAKH